MTAETGAAALRSGPSYWWQSYRMMVRWELTNLRLLLPVTAMVQIISGGGFVLGVGLFFSDIPDRAALFVSTGVLVITLVLVGLVMGPQLIAQQKQNQTYDFMWSLPVPRITAAAAWVTMNMVIAILAKRLSIGRVIVKLNTLNLRSTCKEVGIDHVILPKLTASMEITSILHGYNVLNLSYLVKKGARLLELTPEGLAGKQTQELSLPEGTLLIAIIRGDVATVPHGKTKLRDDDTLLILAESPEKLSQVEKLFERSKESPDAKSETED